MPEEIEEAKELTLEAAAPHLGNLDQAFKLMGRAFKLLTYEQGRIEAEYQDSYPEDGQASLAKAVNSLNNSSKEIKALAHEVRGLAESAYGSEEKEK